MMELWISFRVFCFPRHIMRRCGLSLSVLDPTAVFSTSTRSMRPWESQPPPFTQATRL